MPDNETMRDYLRKPLIVKAAQWHEGDPPLPGMVRPPLEPPPKQWELSDGLYILPRASGTRGSVVHDGDWIVYAPDGRQKWMNDANFRANYWALDD